MKSRSVTTIANATRAFDLGSLLLAFVLAAWLAAGGEQHMPFQEVLAIRIKLQNFVLLLLVIAVWAFVLTRFGLYQTYIYRSKWRDMKTAIAAVSCCAVVLWMIHLAFRIELVGPEFLIDFWLIALACSIACRFGTRLALACTRRHGHNLRHVLIVGSSQRAVEVARRVQAVPELGYHLIGFVDEHWSGSEAFQRAGYKVVTDFAGFAQFISNNVVDEVLVSIPVKSLYERCSQLLAQCEEQGITARFISDVFTPSAGRAYIERFDNMLVLTIDTGGMRGWAVGIKRLIDIVGAATLLIILSPLLLAVALAIRLRSAGPVFFVQERIGLNKRHFNLYKFRTMVPGAEAKLAELLPLNEVGGPVFKLSNDPRITPIGRFLRKSSLDELPQLFNVLKGDMSLVGPRPLPLRDYQSFSSARHRRRFSVKPGITCLWQVMGRSSIPFERWMELDMQYIDQWSLRLDFEILLKTIPAVVKGSGAH